jgi:hypothetical protein
MNAGYFGTVAVGSFITGNALATAVGISAGTSQFSNEGWLKFAYNGKIQFVAKKPIRYNLTWDNINAAGCVTGTKTVVIGGKTYKVRLFRGSNTTTPATVDGAPCQYSEWNKLMLPIHIQAQDKSWAEPASVEADCAYWGINFSNGDLLVEVYSGNGSCSICQELVSTNCVRRGGYNGVSDGNGTTKNFASAASGWRPVLELV